MANANPANPPPAMATSYISYEEMVPGAKSVLTKVLTLIFYRKLRIEMPIAS